jgi:osmotically-inducible protein OsmY
MLKFRKMYMVAVGLTLATALSGLATAGTCGGCGDDAQIKAAITTSFQERPYLGAPNSIRVQTVNRVVYLSGGVSAGLMSRTAEEIARRTPGVERVVNTISVTK